MFSVVVVYAVVSRPYAPLGGKKIGNAVVSLSASSFACRCSLVSAFKRACRGLSFWDLLPGPFISVLPIFFMHHFKALEP